MGRPDHVSLIDIQIKCAQPTITDEWLISKNPTFQAEFTLFKWKMYIYSLTLLFMYSQ